VPADTGKNRIILKITIDVGQEVQIEQIMLSGNSAFDEGQLRGVMDETVEKQWWKFWSSPKLDRKKEEEDTKLIVLHHRKNAYRDAPGHIRTVFDLTREQRYQFRMEVSRDGE